MDEISNLMNQLADKDGFTDTSISGVRIFKESSSQPRQPLAYDQGIIIVGQGTKRIYVGNLSYEYNRDNYLVLSVPLPAECETFASLETPLLLMTVDLDIERLNRIIVQMDQYIDPFQADKNGAQQGLFRAHMTPEIQHNALRLLRALQSPMESQVIGDGIIHELVFRIMCAENASSLYALAMKNTNMSKIDKALKLIHGSYWDSIDVSKLAGIVNMSPSAFHRAFKEVTSSSPIQYLKKVRLDKAKSLLVERGIRVNEAASEVGYESVSQFSREFKRYYGNSPASFISSSNG